MEGVEENEGGTDVPSEGQLMGTIEGGEESFIMTLNVCDECEWGCVFLLLFCSSSVLGSDLQMRLLTYYV